MVMTFVRVCGMSAKGMSCELCCKSLNSALQPQSDSETG